MPHTYCRTLQQDEPPPRARSVSPHGVSSREAVTVHSPSNSPPPQTALVDSTNIDCGVINTADETLCSDHSEAGSGSTVTNVSSIGRARRKSLKENKKAALVSTLEKVKWALCRQKKS